MFTNENSVNDMSAMLSSDNFAFGGMLSYAAQWPDFTGSNFNGMDVDLFIEETFNSGSYSFM